jgi:hypothetical protein
MPGYFAIFANFLAGLPLAGRKSARILALAAGLFAAPASAQTVAQVNAEATILEPLSLLSTADMNFGTISNVSGGGTIVMVPTASASCNATAGLIHTSVCQPAVFEGIGTPGRNVMLQKPGSITLSGPGGAAMAITGVNLDTAPDLTYVSGNPNSNGFVRYRIDSPSGAFAFRIGGTLNVNPGQTVGVYTGSFTVQINYQ